MVGMFGGSVGELASNFFSDDGLVLLAKFLSLSFPPSLSVSPFPLLQSPLHSPNHSSTSLNASQPMEFAQVSTIVLEYLCKFYTSACIILLYLYL